MATIESSIALNDDFSGVLNNIISTVNMAVSAIGEMQDAMDAEIDTSSVEAMEESLAQATVQMQRLQDASNGIDRNVEECDYQQQKFNRSLQEGVNYANNLQGYITKALSAFVGIQGVRKAVNWIEECTEAYNEALNYQTQLMAVLANSLDEDYVNSFIVDISADTSSAEESMAALSNQMDTISAMAIETEDNTVIDVTADTTAAVDALNTLANPIEITADTASAIDAIDVLTRPIEITADMAETMNAIDAVTGSMNADINVAADTSTAVDALDAITGTLNADISVTADATAATEAIEAITGTMDTSIRVSSDTSEVIKTFDALTAPLSTNVAVSTNAAEVADTLDAIPSQISISADVSSNISELTDAIDSVPNQIDINANVLANTSEAMDAIDEVTGVMTANVDVVADTTEAMDSIAEVTGTMVANVNVAANTKRATKALSAIPDEIDAMLTVTADTAEAMDAIAEVSEGIDEIMYTTAEIDAVANVSADTTDAANAIADLSGQVVTIEVQAATNALQSEFDQIITKANEIEASGIYTSSAMTAAAAEFATYFSDIDAITAMMDTLSNYAIGMNGVVELSEKEMVDYATNLGKIMTGSYDAMTKKGFEFNDAQKAIIEGEATQEQIISELGVEYLSMSEDMQAAAAIANVINDSWDGLYETMSNTPEGQVIQLTNAFNNLKAAAGEQFSAGVQAFTQIIWDNWPTIETIVNGITIAMQYLMGIIGAVMDIAFSAAQVIIDNWSQIEPILTVIGTALVIAGAAMAAYQVATSAAAAAQWLLSSGAIVFIGIVALIAAGIYQLGSYFSQVTGLGVSGFAMIAGAVNVVIQAVKNLGLTVADIGLGIWGAIQALVSNIQTAFHNAIANVQIAFYDLLATAMEVISQIANALNKLPFVSIDVEGLTSAADAYAAKAAEIEAGKGEYQSISDAFNEGFSRFDTFTEGWAFEAFESGAAWADNLTSMFDDMETGISADDFVSSFDGLGGMNDLLEDIAGSTGSAAGSAADIADHLDVTDEELKYLRDIAEKDTVNRFTTAEVRIDQTNNNSFAQGMDFDIILDNLTDMMDEAVDIATAGVHA